MNLVNPHISGLNGMGLTLLESLKKQLQDKISTSQSTTTPEPIESEESIIKNWKLGYTPAGSGKKAYAAAHQNEIDNLDLSIDPASGLPTRYLTPMHASNINNFATLLFHYLAQKCPQNKGIETNNCVMGAQVMAEVEHYNLAYANGFRTWSEVQKKYEDAKKVLESLPVPFPSFKEQLKNSGKVFASMIAGFVTAGPVGFFVGAGTATAQIVAEARNKKALQSLTQIQQIATTAQQAGIAKSAIEQIPETTEAGFNWIAGLIILSLVGGAIILSNQNTKK